MITSNNWRRMPPNMKHWDPDLAANFWRLKREEHLGVIFYNYTINTANPECYDTMFRAMIDKILTKSSKVLMDNETRGAAFDLRKYSVTMLEYTKLDIPKSLRYKVSNTLLDLANIVKDLNLTQRILYKAPITGVYSESLEVISKDRLNAIRYWFPDYSSYTRASNQDTVNTFLENRPKAFGVNDAISIVKNAMRTMDELNQLLSVGRIIYTDNNFYHVIRNQFVYYCCYLVLEHLKSLDLLDSEHATLEYQVKHVFDVAGISNRVVYPVVYTNSGALTSRHYAFAGINARYTNGKEAKGYTNFPQIELYYLYQLFRSIRRTPQLQLKTSKEDTRSE